MANTLNISLSAEQKGWLNSRREAGGFASTSDVVRELIRNRQEKEQAELLERFQQLDGDGSAAADADWDTKDGHYRVRLEGDWVDVPEDAVVAGPNRAGRTVVWLYYIDGHPQVRCFIPGTMT